VSGVFPRQSVHRCSVKPGLLCCLPLMCVAQVACDRWYVALTD
jgi:hypothetical protein